MNNTHHLKRKLRRGAGLPSDSYLDINVCKTIAFVELLKSIEIDRHELLKYYYFHGQEEIAEEEMLSQSWKENVPVGEDIEMKFSDTPASMPLPSYANDRYWLALNRRGYSLKFNELMNFVFEDVFDKIEIAILFTESCTCKIFMMTNLTYEQLRTEIINLALSWKIDPYWESRSDEEDSESSWDEEDTLNNTRVIKILY